MEEMTNATSLKYRKIGSTNNTKSILLFVNSIARSNLEMELVLRGGDLVSIPTDPQPSTSTASPLMSTVSKRSCIGMIRKWRNRKQEEQFWNLGIENLIIPSQFPYFMSWEFITRSCRLINVYRKAGNGFWASGSFQTLQ